MYLPALILGNDLVWAEAVSAPVLTVDPTPTEDVSERDEPTFPVCANSSSVSRVEESRHVTAEAVDSPSDLPVEDVKREGEVPAISYQLICF